ncbi:MAG: FtsX-like permease family protein [Ktedonobacterales bacterium]
MRGQPDVSSADADTATRADGERDPALRRDTSVWGGRHPGPLAAPRLAVLRLRRRWRPLLAINAGILLASILICGLPLYTGLINDLQLQRLLASSDSSNVNIDIGVTTVRTDADAAGGIGEQVAGFGEMLSAFAAQDSWRYASLTRMTFAGVNGTYANVRALGIDTSAALAYTLDLKAAEPQMTLMQGRLPQDVAPGQPLEALVTPKLGVKPGDTITLTESAANSRQLTIRVAGVWFPTHPDDPYWGGFSWDTHENTLLAHPGDPPPTFPLLFTPNAFFAALTTFSAPENSALAGPALGMRLDYLYGVQRGTLTVQNMQAASATLLRLRSQLDAYLLGQYGTRSVAVATGLDTLIATVQAQLTLLALPLTLVIVTLAGAALLFTVLMAGLLIEDDAAEIATLATRGASGAQMMSVFATQSVLLAIVTACASPLLAVWLVIVAVRRIVPASGASAAYLSRVTPAGSVTSAAALAALVGVAAVVVGAGRAARLDVSAFRREQGRATRRPLWQRLYLDVALALLCAAGYADLLVFGGLAVRSTLARGGTSQSPDPVLVAVPLLSLLAGTLLLLRLFPLVGTLGAWLAQRGRGAPGMLAFAQLSRGGGQFMRLVSLLTLCVGLGVFALGFGASLTQNAHDRAAYAAGGDMQVTLQEAVQKTPFARDVGARFARLPGVTAGTPIYRSQAHTSADTGGQLFNLLGVDPATFPGVAYWRGDFAAQPLASLMRAMRSHAGNPHAGEPSAPLWMLVGSSLASNLALRPGDRFEMQPVEGGQYTISCVVGAIVSGFPTLYGSASGGYVAGDLADLLAAYDNPVLGNLTFVGPTEYWLRTTASASDAQARGQALSDPSLYVGSTLTRQTLDAEIGGGPSQAGVSALLLAGVVMAATLALFGAAVQAGIAARRRHAQFAVLHAIGGSERQLTAVVLWQQVAVYAFCLVAGSLLGVLLAALTLPTLQFAGATSGAGAAVPPYLLSFNPLAAAAFVAVLVVALAGSLALASGRVGGHGAEALRVAED